MENTEVNKYQEINSALALKAASGDSAALSQLWELNQGLIHSVLWKWYRKNQDTANRHGITMEDLEQESFFAVKAAADHYNPEKGDFATILSFYIRNQVYKALWGDHVRTVTDEQGNRHQLSGNPLDDCTSLDVPIGSEDSDAVLLDVQQDQNALKPFERVEDEIYTNQLHNALEEALEHFTAKQAGVIRAHWFKGKSFQKVAAEYGISAEYARRIEKDCFRKMQKFQFLEQYHDDIISQRAYHGTGLDAWKHQGSVEERTVEYLDERNLLYLWQNWRVQNCCTVPSGEPDKT